MLVTGIGGSGVITVGALLGMAAHLEGKGCSVLDVTGLAQKNGPVTSHVRIAARPDAIAATRIAAGAADLVIGCDIVVTTGAENLAKISAGRTAAIVNSHVAPTSEFATNPDLDLSSRRMEEAIRGAAGDRACDFVAATRLATALCGDAIFTNPFLMGFAYQRGLLPGRARRARARVRAQRARGGSEPARVRVGPARRPRSRRGRGRGAPRAARIPARRGRGGARRDRRAAGRVPDRLPGCALCRGAIARASSAWRRASRRSAPGSTRLARAVARYYFKLLAVKDEFEVARLYTDGSFQRQLAAEFEGDYRLYVHFAPPFTIPVIDWLTERRDPETGRMRKWRIPARWFLPALALLAKLKFLRGTPLNLFGRTAHRRLEQQLCRDYEATLDQLLENLGERNLDIAVEIASLPEHVRGFEQVREHHIEKVRAKQDELLAAYRLHS